jgi:hypothetical protein
MTTPPEELRIEQLSTDKIAKHSLETLRAIAAVILSIYEERATGDDNLPNFLKGFVPNSPDQPSQLAGLLAAFMSRGYRIASSDVGYFNAAQSRNLLLPHLNTNLPPNLVVAGDRISGTVANTAIKFWAAGWTSLVTADKRQPIFIPPEKDYSKDLNPLSLIPDDQTGLVLHSVYKAVR